ncbi:GNAT family N-acetyltransferase [Radiobacillus sp. PE A8.2]|uniref:GNAT family N-acetyltransferase n=1 Tax=Radiobacillus sp. PE A8.2 TaxID=3380349 RepID=UPI00388F0942
MTTFDHISTTDRLIIRPLQASDYTNWLHGFSDRLPSQHRHDQGKIDMTACTEQWFSDLVKKHQQLAADDVAYVFGIFRLDDGMHVGMVDFSTLERMDFQWGRIGYSIHNQYWRRGYGKEAIAEALQIGFAQLNYHRIEAHINLDNSASIRLAESVGMEFECTRKAFIYEFGGWTDNHVYFVNAE